MDNFKQLDLFPKYVSTEQNQVYHFLLNMIKRPDLKEVKKIISQHNIRIDDVLSDSLLRACVGSSPEIIQYIILDNKIDINVGGSTLIRCASFFNKEEIVKFLLENGADPNSTTRTSVGNWLCLTRSVFKENLSMAKKLIDYGANIHARDNEVIRHAQTESSILFLTNYFTLDEIKKSYDQSDALMLTPFIKKLSIIKKMSDSFDHLS